MVRTYILYVHDDRYSVPTLDTVIVRNDARAIEIADKRLASSAHYGAVEVWEDERLVYRTNRPDLSPANDQDAPTPFN